MKSILLEECSILSSIVDVISPNFVTRKDGVVFALCYSHKGFFSGSSEKGNYFLISSSSLNNVDSEAGKCLCIRDCGSFKIGEGYTRVDTTGSVGSAYAILENNKGLPEYCSLDSICNTTYKVNSSKNIISIALPIDFRFKTGDDTILVITENALKGKVMGYIDLTKPYSGTKYITSSSFTYSRFDLNFDLVKDTKFSEVDIIPFFELLEAIDDIER